jgi:uncharacterized protein YbcI
MREQSHRPSGSATLKNREPSLRAELELANAVVGIYKHQLGRGPTRARVVWAGLDLVVCTLEDTCSPAEQRLAAMGEHQRLRESRLFMQQAAADMFIETAERITGRKVRAFISGMDTHADVSSELFYFEPEPEPEPNGQAPQASLPPPGG